MVRRDRCHCPRKQKLIAFTLMISFFVIMRDEMLNGTSRTGSEAFTRRTRTRAPAAVTCLIHWGLMHYVVLVAVRRDTLCHTRPGPRSACREGQRVLTIVYGHRPRI